MSLTYSLYRLAQWSCRWWPRDACLQLVERLADWHWQRSEQDRAAVQTNLTILLNRPVTAREPVVREVFRNFARYLLEFLMARRLQDSGMAVEGAEQLTRVVQPGQGNIILSAHIGNWELGAVAIREVGIPFSVVALPHRDPQVNRLFDEQRRRCGVGVVPLGQRTTLECLKLLRTGQCLGILGDREFSDNGLSVQLFGQQTTLPRGPAVLSLRTGAPVIPVFFLRESPWRFRFDIGSPIHPPRGPWDDAQVQHLTQIYTTIIEQRIRQVPTQWLMLQPFPQNLLAPFTRQEQDANQPAMQAP